MFVTSKQLPFIAAYTSTVFNELTTSDHKSFHIDIRRDEIMKLKETSTSSPLYRSLQSNNSKVIRKYKASLQKNHKDFVGKKRAKTKK